MAQFPSSIISFSTKVNGAVIDANDVNSPQSEITALETKVGVDGSADTTSLDYKVTNVTSGGGGHVQTANKGGTGQTSYTKGDILVASSASVLGKVAVGSDGAVLVADSSQTTGIKWGSSGGTVSSFLSNGTWTKPTSISYVMVDVVGAGGGGGGGRSRASAADAGGGGGGGSGGYSKWYFPSSILGATEAITVGEGGGGGAQGSTGGTGADGAKSSFGSWLTADGGFGGTGGASGAPGAGGAGGQGATMMGNRGADGGLNTSPPSGAGCVLGLMPTGGGGGAGSTGSDHNGSAGGSILATKTPGGTGGTGGVPSSVAGGVGNIPSIYSIVIGGTGGGGGGSDDDAIGGTGGAGRKGSGGGGGGAGSVAGVGGAGGDGFVLVTEYI